MIYNVLTYSIDEFDYIDCKVKNIYVIIICIIYIYVIIL